MSLLLRTKILTINGEQHTGQYCNQKSGSRIWTFDGGKTWDTYPLFALRKAQGQS